MVIYKLVVHPFLFPLALPPSLLPSLPPSSPPSLPPPLPSSLPSLSHVFRVSVTQVCDTLLSELLICYAKPV